MPPETDVLANLLAQFDAEEEGSEPQAEEEVTAAVPTSPSPEVPEDGEQEEEEEEPESEEPEPGVEEHEDEEEGEEEEEEGGAQEEESVSAEYDPEIRAFLAKYGGDEKAALKAGAELARLIGRRDRERETLASRNAELEAELMEARTLNAGFVPLNEDQRAWVEVAAGSVNPGAYVRQALEQGHFDLARAVCREWAHENPYEAGRVGQYIDLAEYQSRQAEETPVTATTDQIVEALTNEMPEMRAFLEQMTTVTHQLGADHPLVLEARSGHPEEAMRGIIGIYEIARASTATVEDAKVQLKKRQRREADDERRRGVVSSASNSPSPSETPRRSREIMPGLTLEQLETEFAQS